MNFAYEQSKPSKKIVVIDGQIGYVGGFNVGDEYLGKSKIRLLARYAFTNCPGMQ